MFLQIKVKTKSNFIVITTENQNLLENILYDLAKLYSDTDCVKGIPLNRKKGVYTDFLIRFINEPDFERFNYLVNSLEYPFDREQFQFTIRGFYNSIKLYEFPQLIESNWLMIYVNPKDKPGEIVYIANQANKSFIYGFGGNLTPNESISLPYNFVGVYKESYHHITDIYPAPKEGVDQQP